MTSKAKCLLCGSSQKKFADSWGRWWFLSTIVQSLSCVQLLWHHGLQHTSLSCPSLCPGICSNSCPLRWWCHPAISSSVTPFSSCPYSFSSSGSFPVSQLFTSGGQSIRASASVLTINTQGWFPLGWTGWISLQSKGLSSVFSNTTVWNPQFCDVSKVQMLRDETEKMDRVI